MIIDVISHIYPTVNDPSSGIFIQKEARLLHSTFGINIYIPTVFALPFQSQYKRSRFPVKETFNVENIPYISIPRRRLPRLTTLTLAKKLQRTLSHSNSNIIHIHWLFPSGFTAPFLKNLKKPIILTLHGGDWYSNQNRGFDTQIQKTLEACDAITTVGKQLKNDIIKAFPHYEEKIHHIPHGINTKIFKPPIINEKKNCRLDLNWEDPMIHILCVANFYKVKGVDILIHALSKLKTNTPFKLHIVAPRRDPNVEKKIANEINRYGLKEKVNLYPTMGEAELVKFYKAADIFVSPSRKEGFGLSIAEAISSGIPVVCTKSGGPEEIVIKEVGLLAEVNNATSLAAQLDKMLISYKSFKSEFLHTYVKKNFSEGAKLNRFRELYKSLT